MRENKDLKLKGPKVKLIVGISYLPNIDLDLGTYLGGSSWKGG